MGGTGVNLRPEEITSVLKQEIEGFDARTVVEDVGTVLTVGDGISRVYGLRTAMAGELLEFETGVRGMALNLEEENVGVVLLGDDTKVREGELVRRTGRIV